MTAKQFEDTDIAIAFPFITVPSVEPILIFWTSGFDRSWEVVYCPVHPLQPSRTVGAGLARDGVDGIRPDFDKQDRDEHIEISADTCPMCLGTGRSLSFTHCPCVPCAGSGSALVDWRLAG